MITQPRAGYKRQGIPGGAAGSLIGVVNMGIKPGFSTLSSLTWLTRGVYASIANVVDNYRKEGRRLAPELFNVTSSLSTVNNEEAKNANNKESSLAANIAANSSGIHPKVCQGIIDEFEKIKLEYEQRVNSSWTKKIQQISFPRNIKNKRSSSVDKRVDSSRKAEN